MSNKAVPAVEGEMQQFQDDYDASKFGWFAAALNVTSNDLIPEEITQLFSVKPTKSQTAGVPIVKWNDKSITFTPKFGRWSFKMPSIHKLEWDTEEVIHQLLALLPNDIDIWEKVAEKGRIQMSIGWSHPVAFSGGFTLEPETLRMLSERKIAVWFDIYNADNV